MKAIKKISVAVLERLGNAEAREKNLLVKTLAKALTVRTVSRWAVWAEN